MTARYFEDVATPSDFQELVNEYRSFRRSVSSYWCDFDYPTLVQACDILHKECQTTDPVRKCMALSILLNYASEGRTELLNELLELPIPDTSAHSKFILRCIAKWFRCDEFGPDGPMSNALQKFRYHVPAQIGLSFVEMLLEKAPETAKYISIDVAMMIFNALISEPSLRENCLRAMRKFLKLGSVALPDDIFTNIGQYMNDEQIQEFFELVLWKTPALYPSVSLAYAKLEKAVGILVYRIDRFPQQREEILAKVQNSKKISWFLAAVRVVPDLIQNQNFVSSLLECLSAEVRAEAPKHREVVELFSFLKVNSVDIFESKVVEWKKAVVENETSDLSLLLSVLYETNDRQFLGVLEERILTDTKKCCQYLKKNQPLKYEVADFRAVLEKISKSLETDLFMDPKIRKMLIESFRLFGESAYWDHVTTLLALACIDLRPSVRIAIIKAIIPPYPACLFEAQTLKTIDGLGKDLNCGVRLAAVELLCKLAKTGEKSPYFDAFLKPESRFTSIGGVPRTMRTICEQAELVYTMCSNLGDLRLSGEIRSSYETWLGLGNVATKTVVETQLVRRTLLAAVKSLQFAIKRDCKYFVDDLGKIWDLLLGILAKNSYEPVLYETLLTIEIILEQRDEFVCKARQDLEFHQLLYQAGAAVVSSKTGMHSLIFRIIGRIGIVRPREPQRDLFYEPHPFRSFELRRKQHNTFQYSRVVASSLLALCKKRPDPKLHVSTIEILTLIMGYHLSNGDSGQVECLFDDFMDEFRRALRLAEFRDPSYVRLLKILCSVDSDRIRDLLLDDVIQFQSIRPFSVMAQTWKSQLRDRLDELIMLVRSSKDGNPSKVLLTFLLCCEPEPHHTQAIFEHMIARADMFGLDKDFDALSEAFNHVTDQSTAPLALGACMRHLEKRGARDLLVVLFSQFGNKSLKYYKEAVMARLEQLHITLDLSKSSSLKTFIEVKSPRHWRREIVHVQQDQDKTVETFHLHFSKFWSRLNDIQAWFKELVYMSIRKAHNAFIRDAAAIAWHSYTTAIDIFPAAFHSLYTSWRPNAPTFMEIEQDVSKVFTHILQMKEPADVVTSVINLVTFMDRAGASVVGLYQNPLSVCCCVKSPSKLTDVALSLRGSWLQYDKTPESRQQLSIEYAKASMYTQAVELEPEQLSLSKWETYLPEQNGVLSVIKEALSLAASQEKSRIVSLFEKLGEIGGPYFHQGFSALGPYVVAANCLDQLMTDVPTTSPELGYVNPAPLLVRIDALSQSGQDSTTEKQFLLHSLVEKMELDLFMACYSLFYKETEDIPLSVKVDHLQYSIWRPPSGEEAQKERDHCFTELIKEAQSDKSILYRLQTERLLWLMRGNEPVTALSSALNSMECNLSNTEMTYVMALATLNVASETYDKTLVEKALSLFRTVAVEDRIRGEACLMQIFRLAFKQAPRLDLNAIEPVFDSIPRHLFVPVIDQLISCQTVADRTLRQFVCKLLSELIVEFPTALVWPYRFSMNFDGIIVTVSPAVVRDDVPIKAVVNSAKMANRLVADVFHQADTIFESFSDICFTPRIVCAEIAGRVITCARALLGAETAEKKARELDLFQRNNRPLIDILEAESNTNSTARTLLQIVEDLISRNRQPSQLSNEARKQYNNIKGTPEEDLTISKVAPQLHSLTDKCLIPVFGTSPGACDVTIQSWDDSIHVFKSLNSPRWITLTGSDGKDYRFIIKAMEDLRTDKRAMQVLSLVNKLANFQSVTYSVIPLSLHLGIIQFLSGTTSLSTLICDYRECVASVGKMREIILFKERAGMKNFEDPPRDPVGTFEYVLSQTKDRENDLREMLWMWVSTSEDWLNLQRHFSESTAVMSMIGSVIGLGDRHSENIMIDSKTGSVVHIDYGDALWRGEERLRFKEHVPFRLTRMMIAAMGPTGYNGPFHRTCEFVMSTLRRHLELVLAILNIFQDDPVSQQPNTDVISLGRVMSQQHRALEHGKKLVSKFADKITGPNTSVVEHVDSLIRAATDPKNLSAMYLPWQPFW